jgi:putative Holliday junction resolvase
MKGIIMRVLAIDYGMARTGIALSDPTGLIASPYKVIPSKNYEKLLDGIGQVLSECTPEKVILGYPGRTDGAMSEMCERVLRFREEIRQRFGVEAELLDEKYTTVIASQMLHSGGIKAKEQRKTIDAAAAAVLLQGYLDAHRN